MFLRTNFLAKMFGHSFDPTGADIGDFPSSPQDSAGFRPAFGQQHHALCPTMGACLSASIRSTATPSARRLEETMPMH
jgi:hypothetical protein